MSSGNSLYTVYPQITLFHGSKGKGETRVFKRGGGVVENEFGLVWGEWGEGIFNPAKDLGKA